MPLPDLGKQPDSPLGNVRRTYCTSGTIVKRRDEFELDVERLRLVGGIKHHRRRAPATGAFISSSRFRIGVGNVRDACFAWIISFGVVARRLGCGTPALVVVLCGEQWMYAWHGWDGTVGSLLMIGEMHTDM